MFGLLFALSPRSYADGLDSPLEIYEGDGSLTLYYNGDPVSPISTFGLINDKSGLTSIDLAVYSSVFDYREENTFVPSADIGFSKMFTTTALKSYFQKQTIKSVEDFYTAFNNLFGYTIYLNYAQDDGSTLVPKGTRLDLNLNFNDTVYGGAGYGGYATYTSSGKYNYFYISSTGSQFQRNDAAPLSLSSNDYRLSSNGAQTYYGNTVTIGGVNLDGEEITIYTYNDIDVLQQSFTMPDDMSLVYIDVSYSPANVNDYSISDRVYFIELSWGANISGSIELSDTGVISGLIGNIITWLKSILSAIQALPQQIADLVVNGIKSLFVPSSENIMATFDGLKTMAETKLGFLYTIFQMVYDLFNSLVTGVTNPMQTLTIPRFAFPFALADGGEICLWEEMTFDILPSGMEVLHNLVKTVTSIVIVLATMSHCVEYFRAFFKKE